ncbi:hypothetical protein AXF42_Ash000965 [Apostasia shenzhenica]|uniref:Bromodomain associated domain-containing protein n=1 Tax=Apostasia shenzhenica TaxID=1088818 RepID=A0A2I0ATL2_9ASPA|nr:hypothetical protein AXF42_Ash000965 [Apostasia shenzhenica]
MVTGPMDRSSSEASSSSSSPPPYVTAVCRVAVAQICLTNGYQGAECAALRALTDVAACYMRCLGASASSTAHSRGRTQSNLFDLVAALEHLAAGRGFPDASDIRRPLLRSSVLLELRAFVAAIDEIPFPCSLRRRTENRPVVARSLSFAQAARDPPLPHVPPWLPRFPDGWESGAGRSDVLVSGIASSLMERSLEPLAVGRRLALVRQSEGPTEPSVTGERLTQTRRSNVVRELELPPKKRWPEPPEMGEGITTADRVGRVKFRLGFAGGERREKSKKMKIMNNCFTEMELKDQRDEKGEEFPIKFCCLHEDSKCGDFSSSLKEAKVCTIISKVACLGDF